MAMRLRPEEFYRGHPRGKPRRLAEQFVNTIRRRQQGLTLAHLPKEGSYNKGIVNDYRREGYRKSGAQTVCQPVDKILALTERDNRFIERVISFTIHPPPDEEIGFWKLDDERACRAFNDLTFLILFDYFNAILMLWWNTNLILILERAGSDDHFQTIRVKDKTVKNILILKVLSFKKKRKKGYIFRSNQNRRKFLPNRLNFHLTN